MKKAPTTQQKITRIDEAIARLEVEKRIIQINLDTIKEIEECRREA